jgi:cytochrome P450
MLDTIGNHHKKQRKLLNPVFSAKHVSSLSPLFYNITRKLRNAVAKRVANGPQELDMLDWVSRAALEIIGVAGMGHSFEDFEQDTSSAPFTEAVKDYT